MILASHGIIGSQIVQAPPGPLLDDYPGAATAYSLRQLRSNYGGSAIGVRIDTTGQPEYNIGFVDGELDVATLEGYCTGGLNAYVKTWYDQSGNARDATQSTAASQPQIVSSGSVITENGKPCIEFNGTSQLLETTTSIVSTDFGVFGVGNQNNSSNGVLFTQYSSFDVTRTLFYMENNTTRLIGIQIGTSSLKTGTPTNAQKLYYYNRLGGDIEYADNGSAVNTFVNSTTCQSAVLRMGAYSTGTLQYTKQNIQELVIYTTSQSSNRTGIETNINTYYDIY